jgi:hypothetical protein
MCKGRSAWRADVVLGGADPDEEYGSCTTHIERLIADGAAGRSAKERSVARERLVEARRTRAPIIEDRVDRTLGLAETTSDAQLRIDHQLRAEHEEVPFFGGEDGDVGERTWPVDGVHGADVDAGSVARRGAGIGDGEDHAGHLAGGVPRPPVRDFIWDFPALTVYPVLCSPL